MSDFDFVENLDRTEVGRYIVDTCYVCADEEYHYYETAICSDKPWIVVEKYDTKEEAQVGHDKWVKVCEEEKPNKLYSIQSFEEEDL